MFQSVIDLFETDPVGIPRLKDECQGHCAFVLATDS